MRANSSKPRRSSRGVSARAMLGAKLQRRRKDGKTEGQLSLLVMPSSPGRVIIRNARQHNLKGITVELPRRALTVLTRPPGSGKSTPAFDTHYADGQRRHIETLHPIANHCPEPIANPL